MPKVVSIGIAVLDVLARPLPITPSKDDSTRVESIKMMPGGDALNVAVALSTMGVSAGLLTKTGTDLNGEVLIKHLADTSVDTSAVRTDPNRQTSTSLVLIREDGERSFITMKGAHHYFTRDDIDWSYLEGARVVNISSLFGLTNFGIDDAAAVLEFCRARGITTTMDFMYDKTGEEIKRISEILPLLDYALPSALEAEQMTAGSPKEKPTAEETAARLLRLGCRNVVIKLGEKGCYIKTEHLEKHLPSRRVEAVDTTGAGDSFVAGFILGLLRNWDITGCAAFASTIGALNCRRTGATAGVPDAKEVVQYFPASNG
ncbi:MAG: carbohydrate kinase family protein [Spirochaetia bacterium]